MVRHMDYVNSPSLVEFFSRHRSHPEELYESERRFIPYLASSAKSVIDSGCATGGFLDILRHYNPVIEYTGIDVSEALIESAMRQHPDTRFFVADMCEEAPLPERYADLVLALGWLHWEPRYQQALRNLWSLARRYLFFDLRLVKRPEDAESGWQKIEHEPGMWDGRTRTPYITVSFEYALSIMLNELMPKPSRIVAYGYWGRPAPSVTGVTSNVCFATFLLSRDDGATEPSELCLDVPLDIPNWVTQTNRVLSKGLFQECMRGSIA